MFSVEHAHHLVFFNDQYSRGRNRGGRSHANLLTCQAPLTKKVGGSKYRHDCFFADLIDNGEFYTAFLNVHDSRGGVTLRVDPPLFSIMPNFSGNTRRIEKS